MQNVFRQIALISMGLLLLQATVYSQRACDESQNQTIDVQFRNAKLENVLLAISKVTELPIAYSASIRGDEDFIVDLSLKKSNVISVLDEIVKQIPTQRWTCAQGAFFVFSADQPDDILQTKIERITFENVRYLDLGKRVLGAPELDILADTMELRIEASDAIDIEPGNLRTVLLAPESRPVSYSGNFTSVSVSDLLKRLAKDRVILYWSVVQRGSNPRKILVTYY